MDRNTNPGSTTLTFPVALRKESVDRNLAPEMSSQEVFRSLSARRAWIEMLKIGLMLVASLGRSPQGERG